MGSIAGVLHMTGAERIKRPKPCASCLFRAGANAKQVQVWLGHHSPAFTLAACVHLMPDDLPDAAMLDAALGLGAS